MMPGDLAPASYLQEQWFYANGGHQSNYNVGVALLITGPLDVGALTEALGRLATRQEALRTVLTEPAKPGEPVRQVIFDSPVPDVWTVDVSNAASPDTEFHHILLSNVGRSFALTAWPLWNCAIVRLGEYRHGLAFVFHHAIFDGGSTDVLIRDLAVLYEAIVTDRDPGGGLLELDIRYSDFAGWERDETGRIAEQFWRGRLRGADRLRLPVRDGWVEGMPFNLAGVGYPGLPDSVVRRLTVVADDAGARPASAILAAVVTTLAPYHDGDLVIGEAYANRRGHNLGSLIGAVFGYRPLRVQVGRSSTFRDVVRAIHEERTAARVDEHRLPIGRIEQVVPGDSRIPSGRLFDASVTFIPQERERSPFSVRVGDGATVAFGLWDLPILWRRMPVETEFYGATRISFLVHTSPNGLHGAIYGNTAALPDETLAAIGASFSATLAQVSENPMVPLWTEER